MPTFKVPVVRERIASRESTEVTVKARTKIEALIEALEAADKEGLHWQQLEIERGYELITEVDIEKMERIK